MVTGLSINDLSQLLLRGLDEEAAKSAAAALTGDRALVICPMPVASQAAFVVRDDRSPGSTQNILSSRVIVDPTATFTGGVYSWQLFESRILRWFPATKFRRTLYRVTIDGMDVPISGRHAAAAFEQPLYTFVIR